MNIVDGFIYDENVVFQQEDVSGNILALLHEENKYVVHFIKYHRKNFEEYEYHDKIQYSIDNYDEAVSEYKRLFDIWSNPEVKSLESYINKD